MGSREPLTMKRKNTLFVDADACPVKEETLVIARSYDFEPVFVASYASYSADREGKWVFVDQQKEAADLYIVNHTHPCDIVVTQDIGLAGLLTNRHVYVLTIRGQIVSEQNVDVLLSRRYQTYRALNAGERIKGPKPFTRQDRKNFSDALINLLCQFDH
ncbi:UPF0178 protein YqxD [Sporolactobacillus inulinus]|nr:UPF0178 protein YqxD [Sporolactobacillus inulinus]